MIQPDQNTQPDWLALVIKWAGGAVCAVYRAELIADTLHHNLDKYDLIDSSYVVAEKIIGIAGFLCDALGEDTHWPCVSHG